MASEMKTLDDLFIDMLKDLYNAEKQMVKALPKMAKKATSADLQRAFRDHLEQTEGHVERLERIAAEMNNGSLRGQTCEAMEGLVKEGVEIMQDDYEPKVMDAGLIAAAQKVEHYEMAGYGTARAWAQQLGYNNAARLLGETLEEEAAANEKLSRIAEGHVNMEAQTGT